MRDVLALWGANRKTLGLFPEGAFEDCAAEGRLVIAVDANDTLAGYLTFRVQRRLNSAAIIHLCVTHHARGQRCSDELVEWLKQHGQAQQLSSLRLKCRRDYHAEELWQRLGFVARGDVRGRGVETSELTVWVYSYGQPDLFTVADEDSSRLKVVIDANIFYDLHGHDCSRNDESLVLREPWMDDAVRLCVVDELHNEINRCETGSHRDEYHRIANSYSELRYDPNRAAANEIALDELMGTSAQSDSEKSDRRQLARAAAAGADVFVTRDGELLEAAEEIEARLGVRVRRPTELSSQLDETERALAYQPLRLSATGLTFTALRASEVEAVADQMQSHDGEKRAGLIAEIRSHLAKIRSASPSEIKIVRDESGAALALFIRAIESDGRASRIPLLRVPQHPLARTLVRHLLLMAIQTNAVSGRQSLHVTDAHLTALVREALAELYFVPGATGWERITPSFIGPRDSLIAKLKQASPKPSWDHLSVGELEERLWPAKILGESIPNYVVAIDPTWAAQLFDERLAAGELFGAFARLALNRENVYYRSARKAGLTAPARLLWYVTKDDATAGTMAIRACSRLVSVETGAAKVLYGRYRRIGVYEWREVFQTAGQQPQGEVMALRFADTELFPQPVEMTALRQLGITSTFQSPTRIDEGQFRNIYQLGHKLS